MFRMMKLLGAAAILAGVGVYFVSPGSIERYANEGQRIIQEKLDNVPTLERELRNIKSEVESMDEEMERIRGDVIERRVDVDSLKDQIGEQEENLSRLRRGLERAGELLNHDEDSYFVAGVRYSRFEIEQDAELKFEEYQAKEEALANLNDTLKIKEHALQVTAQNLQTSARKRAEFDAQVRLFEAELQRLRAREAYAETVAATPAGKELKTQIGKAQKSLAAFRKKLSVEDRMLVERLKVGPGQPGSIDYDAVAIETQPEISTRIDRYFSGVDLLSKNHTENEEVAQGEVADN